MASSSLQEETPQASTTRGDTGGKEEARAARAARDALELNRFKMTLHAENVRVFSAHRKPQLPVVVVTGFLGSGKTTLLRHLLTNKQNLRIAAAVNDFASLNIDESLIRGMPAQAQASRVVELSNGCVCCSLMGSLKKACLLYTSPSPRDRG